MIYSHVCIIEFYKWGSRDFVIYKKKWSFVTHFSAFQILQVFFSQKGIIVIYSSSHLIIQQALVRFLSGDSYLRTVLKKTNSCLWRMQSLGGESDIEINNGNAMW